MRLINIHTLELKEFMVKPPPYAILSHRWTDDEIDFKDFTKGRNKESRGYQKIKEFCDYIKTRYNRSPNGKAADEEDEAMDVESDDNKSDNGENFSDENLSDENLEDEDLDDEDLNVESDENFDESFDDETLDHENLDWAWVDTCCIDKRSSAELSEAINSMGKWYYNSKICIAYLEDVSGDSEEDVLDEMVQSEWFDRGWTLQELLLPSKLTFCNNGWKDIGSKCQDDTAFSVAERTGIHQDVLMYPRHHIHEDSVCIAEKMSWASRRKTTREEDTAYCLLGLFAVNMPLLYGEGGPNAFRRLQRELISRGMDESIFAWNPIPGYVDPQLTSVLASSPDVFQGCGSITVNDIPERITREPYFITNKGLSFTGLARRVNLEHGDAFKDVEARENRVPTAGDPDVNRRLQNLAALRDDHGVDSHVYIVPLNCKNFALSGGSGSRSTCVLVLWRGMGVWRRIWKLNYGCTIEDFREWWDRGEEVEKQFYIGI